jgi:hypothetical protein
MTQQYRSDALASIHETMEALYDVTTRAWPLLAAFSSFRGPFRGPYFLGAKLS